MAWNDKYLATYINSLSSHSTEFTLGLQYSLAHQKILSGRRHFNIFSDLLQGLVKTSLGNLILEMAVFPIEPYTNWP